MQMSKVIMDTLTTKQRAHLRSLAHTLKPLLHVGKEGATDSVLRTIETAFNTRELIKIKVLDSAPDDARETGELIVARTPGVHLVQVIGRTLVLYRPHPEKRVIKLPRVTTVDPPHDP